MKYVFKIKETRKVNIRVFKKGEVIYSGLSDEAPDEIKELPMNKIEMDNITMNIYIDEIKEEENINGS